MGGGKKDSHREGVTNKKNKTKNKQLPAGGYVVARRN